MDRLESTDSTRRAEGTGAGEPITVRILVGYAWNGSAARDDGRWKAIRAYLDKVSAECASRFGAGEGLLDPTDAEDFADGGSQGGPTQRVRALRVVFGRLRGTPGGTAWDTITRKIDEADLLLFDLTRRAPEDGRSGEESLNANVALELGYALGRRAREPSVFLVCEEYKPEIVPSDLAGVIVGTLGHEGKASDVSLRMALVTSILRIASTKASTDATRK